MSEQQQDPIPKGYWEAADGSLVPVSKISDLDKARDDVVKRLCDAAQTLSVDLAKFKGLAMSEVDQFVQLSAAQYGHTMRGAAGKGNVTLTSFDGRLKVEKAIAARIAFDERLQVAKGIFDDFVMRIQKGSNDTVKLLLARAFRTDKAGNVSVSALLDLRRAEIQDEQWLRGVEALNDCMRVEGSVAYLRFYRRDDTTKPWVPFILNASAA
jgi:Protein of unknown function (DUF3164)